MSELLPCPWCGSDIRLSPINVPWSDNEPCWAIWHVDGTKAYEDKCPMEMGGYDTEAEAVEAWNTRAERTCNRITLGLEREREVATVSWICSACRKHMNKDHNYCPNCGAKVVSEVVSE